MFFSTEIIFLAASVLAMALLIVYIMHLKIERLRYKIEDALHKKAEITNFLSLFSQNMKTLQEVDNSMNMTARYVADLIEAQSICIFAAEGGFLKAVGISGAFPPLHKSTQYVLTKPRYILESLRREKIKFGDGIIGEIAEKRESIFLEDASKDPRLASADSLVPVRSLMAVPLINEANVTGVICAVNNRRNNEKAFSAEQFGSFKFIASQVVLAQNFVEVYTNLSRQQRISQELEFARQLQASLLPKTFPAWDQFVVHSFTRSSKEVSGDFYDFVQIDENRLLIVIGDACGKGIPACMIMAMTRSFIRSCIDHFKTLKELLKELNFNLFRDTDEERFITLAFCLLDKKESTVEYARAGHTELLLFARDHIRRIYPSGSALGLLPNELSSFDTLSFEFTPDMSIMLYTDGISEAINDRKEEFGIDRIEKVFLGSCVSHETPELTIGSIMKAVDDFTINPENQLDDQTIVIIKHL